MVSVDHGHWERAYKYKMQIFFNFGATHKELLHGRMSSLEKQGTILSKFAYT